MTIAYLDTTILTDFHLKAASRKKEITVALAAYQDVLLPGYAIKEFKAGPLNNCVWFYNKILEVGDLAGAIKVLHAISRTPKKNTTSTGLEILSNLLSSTAPGSSQSLIEKYGAKASPDAIRLKQIKVQLKYLISSSWKDRSALATKRVDPLSCYDEEGLVEVRGLLELKNKSCTRSPCCLVELLRDREADIQSMRNVAQAGTRREDQSRSQALRELSRNKGRGFTKKHCRALGDAVFALMAPDGAEILTTNEKDHAPLAAVVGGVVKRI